MRVPERVSGLSFAQTGRPSLVFEGQPRKRRVAQQRATFLPRGPKIKQTLSHCQPPSEVSKARLHGSLQLGGFLRLGLPLQRLVNAGASRAWSRDQARHLRLQVLSCQRPVEAHVARVKYRICAQPVLQCALAVLAARPRLRGVDGGRELERGVKASPAPLAAATAIRPRESQ